MEIDMDVTEEVTREFIECFGKPSNRSGSMWLCIQAGIVPYGVNLNDPRVKRLLAADLAADEVVEP